MMILFYNEIPRRFPSVIVQTSDATISVHECTFLLHCI